MFTEFFPLAVYLLLGILSAVLIGTAVTMIAYDKEQNRSDKTKQPLMIILALGAILLAYIGYQLIASFDFPKQAILGALLYPLAFILGALLSAKIGVRKMFVRTFYALFTIIFAAILFLMLNPNHASQPEKHAHIDVTDKASLQRGAATFRDYCLSCHGLSMVRYNQLSKIGLSKEDIEQKMLTTADKIGDTMQIAMRREDAKKWFGVAPPDLSLEAAAKKPDWIYSYLTGFYKDNTRPTGWNNIYFENVGMPHALWQEEGIKEAIFEDVPDHKDPTKTIKEFKGFTPAKGGKLDAEAFERKANDVTNFLVWASEPDQHSRKMIGFGVLAFLLLLSFMAWKLSKNYWKDIK